MTLSVLKCVGHFIEVKVFLYTADLIHPQHQNFSNVHPIASYIVYWISRDYG